MFRSQIFEFSNFVATSKARIWLAIYEFLWLLTNQNVWFVSFFALKELTLFCTELPENCIYLNQSELSNFSMYIIRCQTKCYIFFCIFSRGKNLESLTLWKTSSNLFTNSIYKLTIKVGGLAKEMFPMNAYRLDVNVFCFSCFF